MNADTRLALFNRTYDVLNKGNWPIENAAKKLLTCGASYKPPALPGDTYPKSLSYFFTMTAQGNRKASI